MDSTAPKPFVFVLMPFSEDFDDIYKLGIKAACEKAGVYAERVDEQLFQDTILNRIYNQIYSGPDFKLPNDFDISNSEHEEYIKNPKDSKLVTLKPGGNIIKEGGRTFVN